MSNLVSVIIPVFNRQEYIGECIRSVWAQTYQDFELILIDDGSTDETPRICREFADEDERITLLNGTHAGVSAARNKGIDAARGEYLFFLDSDDVIHPLLLESLVTAMQKNRAGIARTEKVNVPERYWGKVREACAQKEHACDIIYQDFQQALEGVFFGKTPFHTIGGVMLHRELVGETRFREDVIIGEDFYFTYENMIKEASVVICSNRWYFLRIHGTNSSWNYTYEAFWSRFYRRELVWKSEENFGRLNYAKQQKRDAVTAFLKCVQNNPVRSEDSRKMRSTMKRYVSSLVPVLTWKGKVSFFVAVYLPSLYLWMRKFAKKGIKR